MMTCTSKPLFEDKVHKLFPLGIDIVNGWLPLDDHMYSYTP